MTGSITTAMCTSFKAEVAQGLHNFTTSTGNTFNLCLIKGTLTGTYGAASTNYSNVTGNSDEVGNSGTYAAGGSALTNITPQTSGTTAYWSFSTPVQWTGATISAEGCMIYNTSSSNKAVGVFDFGGVQSVTNGTFSVNMPTNNNTNAILRIQ